MHLSFQSSSVPLVKALVRTLGRGPSETGDPYLQQGAKFRRLFNASMPVLALCPRSAVALVSESSEIASAFPVRAVRCSEGV